MAILESPGTAHWHVRTLGFFAGAVVAVALLALFLGSPFSRALMNRFAPGRLPADLRDALVLMVENGQVAVYHPGSNGYERVSLGSTLPTVYLSRRGSHVASIGQAPDGSQEIHVDGTLVYRSPDPLTSASVSPSGTLIAFAVTRIQAAGAARGDSRVALPSFVSLMRSGEASTTELGTGFAPFFLDDTHVAWFSADGLMARDLTSGSTTVLSAKILPALPPAPAPAVSRDGALIAWQGRDTGTMQVNLVAAGVPVADIASVPVIPGAAAAVIGSQLITIEQSPDGSTLIRHPLYGESKAAQVPGLPVGGIIIGLVP